MIEELPHPHYYCILHHCPGCIFMLVTLVNRPSKSEFNILFINATTFFYESRKFGNKQHTTHFYMQSYKNCSL